MLQFCPPLFLSPGLVLRAGSHFGPVFASHLLWQGHATWVRNLTFHFAYTLAQEVFFGPEVRWV